MVTEYSMFATTDLAAPLAARASDSLRQEYRLIGEHSGQLSPTILVVPLDLLDCSVGS